MKNSDIIKAIYDSDKTGDIIRSVTIYNNRIKNGIVSFTGIEKYKELINLLVQLSNEKYQITDMDRKILQQHNIILPHNNKQNTNFGLQQVQNQPNFAKAKDKSFVVVSDFHSYRYPLDKIKNNYLNEYDVIYILGDATDRGKNNDGAGGVQLLIDIMKLTKQYPGRVIYVPGNHDEFLLGYVRSKYQMDNYYPYSYTANLMYNGGEATINELNRLQRQDPKTFNELISWLGKQPLQRTHRFNGKDYVLGHAIFNQRLYDMNPNYSLENYFKENPRSDTRRMANAVLWFRKFKDAYNPNEMPNADKTMVIGHTIEENWRGKDINLNDSRGRTIKVHCVDGGIAYNGGMLKYDGADKVMRTSYLTHNDTSKKSQNQNPVVVVDSETIFKSHIISRILNGGKQGFHEVISGSNPRELNPNQCKQIIEKSIDPKIAKEESSKRSIYIKTILFDYILESQISRMQEQYREPNYSIYLATEGIDTFLNGSNDRDYIIRNGNNGKGNYYNITRKNYARKIAEIIGPEVMIEVLYAHGCQTVEEYMYNKYLNKNNYANNAKRQY